MLAGFIIVRLFFIILKKQTKSTDRALIKFTDTAWVQISPLLLPSYTISGKLLDLTAFLFSHLQNGRVIMRIKLISVAKSINSLADGSAIYACIC